MEYCKDHSYFETRILNRKKEIKKEHKLKMYARQILTIIDELHNNNIIHADLKL